MAPEGSLDPTNDNQLEVVVPFAFAPHQSGTTVDGFVQPRIAVDHRSGLLNTLLFEQRHDLLQRCFRRQVVLFHLREKTINPLVMVATVGDKKERAMVHGAPVSKMVANGDGAQRLRY